jgi:hypothetical protein
MKNIVHWCMAKKMWTSHTYKSCAKADSVLILGGWTTETKPNRKANPKGWVVTDHTNVVLNPTPEQLSYFRKEARLIYNKEAVSFSEAEGTCLLFDNEGCFILAPA